MPNRSSKTGHIPWRSCVICREGKNKKELIRFILLEKDIIFDLNQDLTGRGYYVCDQNTCLGKVNKWKLKLIKKRGSLNNNGENS